MLNILKNRRSIRKFKDKGVEKEKIEVLQKALLLAPSSRSIKPLEFIFIDDKKLIEELSLSKKAGSAFLKTAPLAVAVFGDENKSDVWIEDASIASIILQLTAETLGLKSCWIQIRNREKNEEISSDDFVREVLNIPERFKVLSIVAIGYPDESRDPSKEEDLDFSVIKNNKYFT